MYSDAELPAFATPGSACFDVCAYFGPKEVMVKSYSDNNAEIKILATRIELDGKTALRLPAGYRALIATGLIMDIPVNHSVRIHPRSGLALKSGIGLANCEGVVDSDYINQLYVAVINNSSNPVIINHGDRIAQLEMVPVLSYNLAEVSAPAPKTSRAGGFGSTGV
jgi:dUTP pyrophosphatase